MEPMTDRNKAGWIIAFTALGWIFFLLPMSGAEIPEGHPTPISHQAWVTWIIINFVMLVLVHLLISREHRAAKRFNRAMQRARKLHPTWRND
jgi:hypothetical protein